MVISVSGLVCSGRAEHSYRLEVPAGHAASIFHAVPSPADSFDLQAQDLADQFEKFRNRYACHPRVCLRLTLLVGSPRHVERAIAFCKHLRGAGTGVTVIANFDDPRWRIALNAYFLEKIQTGSMGDPVPC